MITIPPGLMPQAQGQGLLAGAGQGGGGPVQQPPSQESLFLAAGDMHNQGLLAPPRRYNHGAHVRHRNDGVDVEGNGGSFMGRKGRRR